LQALIGFDEARRTFILRDPSRRTQVEVGANEFLERYGAFGPRAMLMLPQGEAHRIEGVDLPESGLYDRFYRLQKALERHDRAAAALEVEGMHGEAPGHRLTLCARWRLASYDANPVRELEAAEALIALFPKCPRFLWSKVSLLGRISPGKEHRRFLHQMASRRDADAVFWFEWARELGKDARHARFAGRYLLLALRVQPCEAGFLSELGGALWNERRFEQATDVYRLAASVGGVDRWGWSYFQACRHTRRTEEALALFRARYASAGDASAQPARILFAALSALDRSGEAFTLLDEALEKRGEDGDLLLFAADEYARAGKRERAQELLARTEPLTAKGAWLRTKANFADYRCDLAEALGAWEQILALEPLSIDALRAVARLTAEIHGQDAACDFLEKQVERFPHFVPLAELHVEFLRSKPLEIAEGAIRRALGRDSRNAWLRRELALNLAGQRRFAEANHEADEALRIDPHNPISCSTRGRVLELEGRSQAAEEAYREALVLSIDHGYAIEGLFRVCPTFEEKKEAIAFIRAELVHQVVFGDGLLAFREEAYSVLEPRELLEVMREALAARRDLWQAWVVTINQLVDVGEFDEALSLAREAVEQFPLVPRVWTELSQVHRARGEREDEPAPLVHALSLSPAWGFASRALSDALSRQGELAQARVVLEKAVAAAPLDA
jgi:tetratricopeptide (TPR) repeat protein